MTSAKSKTTPEKDAPAPVEPSDAAAPSTAPDAQTAQDQPADQPNPEGHTPDVATGPGPDAPMTPEQAWAIERESIPEGPRELLDQMFADLGFVPQADETDAEFEARANAYAESRGWVIVDGLPTVPAPVESSNPDDTDTCEHGFTRGFVCPSGCWSK